jgi:PAS domain S-box-containing protein
MEQAPPPETVPPLGGDSSSFVPDCLIVTDSRGVILDANPAAAFLLRCGREFVIGKPLPLFAAAGHRSRLSLCLSRLAVGGGSDAFETEFARASEVPRLAAVIASGQGRATGVRWVAEDVTERKRGEAVREDLIRQLATAQEDERRRVARELHDSFGQLLTALTLATHAARHAAPVPLAVAARLDEVERIAGELSRSAHELAVRLRPTMLDDLGLGPALSQLVNDWSARTGVAVEFLPVEVDGLRVPPETETVVYRLVQEALTNVAKHAAATRVSIVVGRRDGQVTVAIEDDGVGFDPDAGVRAGQLGLLGLRERVALAGGAFVIESAPECGTTLLARLPGHTQNRG